MQSHLMHDLIHDKSRTCHISGVFHERYEHIQNQDIRQEHDNTSHATDDTIHEKILQRSFRHMAAHEITDHLDQCLYPFHRIASQTESGLEHDPHE